MMREAFARRGRMMYRAALGDPRRDCLEPQGAFYCFPSFEGVLGREIAGRTPARHARAVRGAARGGQGRDRARRGVRRARLRPPVVRARRRRSRRRRAPHRRSARNLTDLEPAARLRRRRCRGRAGDERGARERTHASLETTTPANNAELPAGQPPKAVSLKFSENVQIPDNAIRRDRGGPGAVDIDAPKHGTSDSVVAVDLPPLPDGTYVVSWRVVSADCARRIGRAVLRGRAFGPPAEHYRRERAGTESRRRFRVRARSHDRIPRRAGVDRQRGFPACHVAGRDRQSRCRVASSGSRGVWPS